MKLLKSSFLLLSLLALGLSACGSSEPSSSEATSSSAAPSSSVEPSSSQSSSSSSEEQRYYTIKWVNYDGTLLETDEKVPEVMVVIQLIQGKNIILILGMAGILK